jgi:hypothetical protein
MENKERVFYLKAYTQMNKDGEVFEEYNIPESELEDKHIKLYCGQLIKDFENSPVLAQEMFKEFLKNNI